MDFSKLIPEKYLYFLEKFSRSSYKGAFEQYCAETAAFFSALDMKAASAETASQETIDSAMNAISAMATCSMQESQIENLLIIKEQIPIKTLVNQNIQTSQEDWDSFETYRNSKR